jgi:hypothetical protein
MNAFPIHNIGPGCPIPPEAVAVHDLYGRWHKILESDGNSPHGELLPLLERETIPLLTIVAMAMAKSWWAGRVSPAE